MVLTKMAPVIVQQDDIHVTISYSYTVGYTWQECGINEVNALLSGLGFKTREEVKAFCFSRNIFKSFSAEGWYRQFISGSDAAEISYYLGAGKNKLFSPELPLKTPASILSGTDNPTYNDFFQFLFSWVTGGDSIERRNYYKKWWEAAAGLPANALNSAILNNTVRDPWKVINNKSSVLKTFKDEIDNFLNFEYGKNKTALQEGSGSVLVDVSHGIQTFFLDLILRESQWQYVSGNEVNVGVNAAIGELGVTVGGGHYSVYNRNSKEKYFPLRFGQIGITGGLAISSPLNLSVNLASMPAAGKIYQAWSGINSAADLSGLYLYVSGSLAIFANVNSSLIFFLPVSTRVPKNLREIALDSALLVTTLLTTIAASKAMMTVSGHGFELAEGLGLSLGYGYVHVGAGYSVK